MFVIAGVCFWFSSMVDTLCSFANCGPSETGAALMCRNRDYLRRQSPALKGFMPAASERTRKPRDIKLGTNSNTAPAVRILKDDLP